MNTRGWHIFFAPSPGPDNDRLARAVPSILLFEEKVSRIKFAQPLQAFSIANFNLLAMHRQEVAVFEIPQHPVHMNGRNAARLSQIGLRHRKGEMRSIASTDRAQSRFRLAEEMADSRNRIEAPEAKYPFAMHGSIKERAEPEQFRKRRARRNKMFERNMGHQRYPTGGQGREVMIKMTKRVAMKVDEIAGHMHCNKLSFSLPVIHVPAHDAFDEIGAHGDILIARDEGLARRQVSHVSYRSFKRFEILGTQEVTPSTSQKVGKHHHHVQHCKMDDQRIRTSPDKGRVQRITHASHR